LSFYLLKTNRTTREPDIYNQTHAAVQSALCQLMSLSRLGSAHICPKAYEC